MGAVIGGVTAAGTAWAQGGTPRQIATATVLGALAGLAGNFVTSATVGGTIVRGAWVLRAIGLGVSSGMVPELNADELRKDPTKVDVDS
ncbi:MAG: hypothetical protein ACFHX7_08125 [Pseudomonadota bacterium]